MPQTPLAASARTHAFSSRQTVSSARSGPVRGIGWKATWSVITGFLRNLDRLHALRRDPDSGIVLNASSRASYSHHQSIGKKVDDWRNPELLELDTELSAKYYQVTRRQCISNVSRKMHERDHHKFAALR
jgi:hypothetical protein